jgi:hypothetical protein
LTGASESNTFIIPENRDTKNTRVTLSTDLCQISLSVLGLQTQDQNLCSSKWLSLDLNNHSIIQLTQIASK